MKRVLFVAAVALACGSKKPPVINSFAASPATVNAGDAVQLTFDVAGARTITILPEANTVTASPVTVHPTGNTTYQLRAENDAGAVSAQTSVTVNPAPAAAAILSFRATPAQAKPGDTVTLAWSVTGAQSITLSDGTTQKDVTNASSTTVQPAATQRYTLSIVGVPGSTPASASAVAVARVLQPATVAAITASKPTATQGDIVQLSWTGTGDSFTVSDGTKTLYNGPALATGQTLAVHPMPPSQTYTVTANGAVGSASKSLQIPVTAQPGGTLNYTNGTGGRVNLIGTCSGGTCSMKLVAGASGASLRGVALDLPADSTKIAISGAGAGSAFSTDAVQAVMGSGPLQDMLVAGVALKGSGSGPAGDVPVASGAELMHFTITVNPNGGVGTVFDGTGARTRIADSNGFSGAGVAVGALTVTP